MGSYFRYIPETIYMKGTAIFPAVTITKVQCLQYCGVSFSVKQTDYFVATAYKVRRKITHHAYTTNIHILYFLVN
jgi:hypothetical protein